mgnify:CR=1 FL=1|jgi:hypothetical protein
MYAVTYEIQQGDIILPVIFVKKKDAIQYASEHNITNYTIIRDTDRKF